MMARADARVWLRRVFPTALVLSVVHAIDDTVRYRQYAPNGGFIPPRALIPLNGLLFVAVGVVGYRLFQRGRRTQGGWLLGIFSLSGLAGLIHYTSVSPEAYDWFQNAVISLGALAGAAILGLAVGGRALAGHSCAPESN